MLAAVALLPGCVAGRTTDDGGSPQRNLAVTPSSLPPEAPPVSGPVVTSSASASASAGGSSGPVATGGASSAPGGTTPPPASSSPGAVTYRVIGSVSDAGTDSGSPPYGDLVGVTVADGGGNARVTVTFAGDVPARLPADETMGVGVDFFHAATQTESDYQLFADGEPDGWFAYLQGPDAKFVRYPGTFGLGGRRLEFTVPWSALGSPSSGRFSAFADWTRDTSPTNVSGQDHAPNLGNAAFTR